MLHFLGRVGFWVLVIVLAFPLAAAAIFFPFLKFLFWVGVIWYLVVQWKDRWYPRFMEILRGYGDHGRGDY